MFKLHNSDIYYNNEIWCPWVHENLSKTMKSNLVDELNGVCADSRKVDIIDGIDLSRTKMQDTLSDLIFYAELD